MEIKINGETSASFDLIGGGLQGSLIGQLLYVIASDNTTEDVPEEDKSKYVDDLSDLKAVISEVKLIQYDVLKLVP